MSKRHKRWRVVITLFLVALLASAIYLASSSSATKSQNIKTIGGSAVMALAKLAIRPAAMMTGYSREQFGGNWETVGDCDMREHVLDQDLTSVVLKSQTDCTVLSGTLQDPYSGKTIRFVRSTATSTQVQIDHVVAIGDAWRTGAQDLSQKQRIELYNDPLELLAVYGPANDQKGDSDASSWLPPNKDYDCRYVARQIAVKTKYKLWITPAEHASMQKVLASCPSQPLPNENN